MLSEAIVRCAWVSSSRSGGIAIPSQGSLAISTRFGATNAEYVCPVKTVLCEEEAHVDAGTFVKLKGVHAGTTAMVLLGIRTA